MRVSLTHEGSVTVVRPTGPMFSGELQEMDRALLDLFNRWTKRLVLNLSDVTMIDSEGLELLVRHQRQFASHGLQIKLAHVNELLLKVLEICRLNSRFEIYPETVNAIRSYL